MNNSLKILRSSVVLMLGVGILFGVGCKKKPEPTAPLEEVQAPIPSPIPEEIKEKPVYVYTGDRFRDPFTAAGASTNYQPEAVFDPQRSIVRGIIFSPRYKSAVINVTGSGVYFVKGSEIIDIMGKKVTDYTARVLIDRVIITGEADNVYEIKIRNDKEEAQKS